MAGGEFILPLDADDRFDPTYADKALAVMHQRPDVGIVYCDAMKFGAASGLWSLPAYSVREMVIDNVIFCSSLFRKSDWEAVGGYNENLRHGMEDYEYFALLEKRAGPQAVQKVVDRIAPSWWEYCRDPDAILAARREMAPAKCFVKRAEQRMAPRAKQRDASRIGFGLMPDERVNVCLPPAARRCMAVPSHVSCSLNL